MDFFAHRRVNRTSFARERIGGGWFFVAPALMYGIFISRLPAIKDVAGIDDAQTGTLLLALGLSTLAGMLASGFVFAKKGCVKITAIAVFWLSIAMTIAVFLGTYHALLMGCILTGLGVGFCDVGMNAIGIDIEKRHKKYCLSFLHGCSCIGGVAGSLAGSLFSLLGLSAFLNLVMVMGVFLSLWPFVAFPDRTPQGGSQCGSTLWNWKNAGFFVFFCGLLSLLCHIGEGAAGQWGSIFLNSAKKAGQSEAALVFASFSGAMLVCRFCVDRARDFFADSYLVLAGSLLGAGGMSIVLLAPWPWVCLCGFAIMGAGLAPVAPIVFSRAGAAPGIAPAQASAVVAVFSYAGMLAIPPLLGIFSKNHGLESTLWIVVGVCLSVGAGAPMFKKRSPAATCVVRKQ